jgi:hypothetical protein
MAFRALSGYLQVGLTDKDENLSIKTMLYSSQVILIDKSHGHWNDLKVSAKKSVFLLRYSMSKKGLYIAREVRKLSFLNHR